MHPVLVIQLARFGDLIQTARLIKSLPNVHLLVDSSLLDLAKILYPEAVVHGLLLHQGQALEVLTTNQPVLANLSQISWQAVYNLNFSPLNFSLSRLFKSSLTKGYGQEDLQIFRSPWLRLAFKWLKNRRTSPLNLVDLWAWLHPMPIAPQLVHPEAKLKGQASSMKASLASNTGVDIASNPEPSMNVNIASNPESMNVNMASSMNVNIASSTNIGIASNIPARSGLGVVLAGREARRSLPMPILAPIIASLWQKLEAPPVWLLGSAAERGLARQLFDLLPRNMAKVTTSLAGKTNYLQLVERIQKLELVVTPDTGSMHLAAAMGTPVQAFFLSSALAFETGPYGLGHSIWQAQTPCAPCLESGPCVADMECLQLFAHPNFLKFLQGQSIDLPPQLLHLEPNFDALGLKLQVVHGIDNQATPRANLRQLLGEYHGLKPQGSSPEMARLGQELYQEIDWILKT